MNYSFFKNPEKTYKDGLLYSSKRQSQSYDELPSMLHAAKYLAAKFLCIPNCLLCLSPKICHMIERRKPWDVSKMSVLVKSVAMLLMSAKKKSTFFPFARYFLEYTVFWLLTGRTLLCSLFPRRWVAQRRVAQGCKAGIEQGTHITCSKLVC